MHTKQHAVHRTILVVDVEGFGNQHKVNPHQVAIRRGLYKSLQRAFHKASIPWTIGHREERGDGCLILVPPEIPKDLFTDALPAELAAALREHNAVHRPERQIRLRMALHAGEVRYDDYGVTSISINLAFRLLNAPPLKAALATSPGVLALIASSWFFDEVVKHSTVVDPASYRRLLVAVKETTAVAWISTPDHPYPATRPSPEDHAGRRAVSHIPLVDLRGVAKVLDALLAIGPVAQIDLDDVDRIYNLLRICWDSERMTRSPGLAAAYSMPRRRSPCHARSGRARRRRSSSMIVATGGFKGPRA
jgi:hypothetical protein